MEDGILLNIIRLVVGVIILSYASYTDIKTRRAANMLWILMGSIGAILLAIQYFTTGFDNILYLVFIPIMIVFMYVLFRLKLIFGGADAKAIMALAILVPLEPAILDFPLWKESIMPFSWIIFSNAVILFILIPLSLLIYNIIKRNVKFPYCVLGYKMSIGTAKQSFVWPLEKIKNGKRRFSYIPKEFDADEGFKVFEDKGIKEIWVTPKIPFMIPLLAGFLVSFILGDILSHIMQFFI
ncbi:MAG: prepilin peptidase [Thermoplasmatales archaeon]|nr:MAG: prepilin peptidase [Thermoplasmatales archaeon]